MSIKTNIFQRNSFDFNRDILNLQKIIITRDFHNDLPYCVCVCVCRVEASSADFTTKILHTSHIHKDTTQIEER